jgi:hypothetical protein
MSGVRGEEVINLLLLAVVSTGQPISVSRGGDDGLTIRFTEAYERATSSIRTVKPLQVTVEQITSLDASRSRVIVRFKSAVSLLPPLTCTFRDDQFSVCVRSVARRTRALGMR